MLIVGDLHASYIKKKSFAMPHESRALLGLFEEET
jgi:hypothetical protein